MKKSADGNIGFEEERHIYTYLPTGVKFQSMSGVLKFVGKDFDAKLIAPMVAKKRDRVSKEEAIRTGKTQAQVLATYPMYSRGITAAMVEQEWLDKAASSHDHGNIIHNTLEAMDLGVIKCINNDEVRKLPIMSQPGIWDRAEPMIPKLRLLHQQLWEEIFCKYHSIEPEYIFYSKKHGVAGMSDKVCFRSSRGGVVDIFDYKTNEFNGILYDSGKNDQYTGEFKFRNNFMNPPLAHLEDCNYNKYSCQLSGYAYMGEIEYNWKIGRLSILYIDENIELHNNPVPYLRFEMEELFNAYLSRNPFSINNVNPQQTLQELFDTSF